MRFLSFRAWLRALRHPRRSATRIASARDVLYARAELSYAQHGEDRVLAGLLDWAPPGFYVDVGAHHPIRLSNTASLYRAGWCGIDVDASPGTVRLFHHYRPRDVALEVGVGAVPGSLPFYVFDDEAVNTFSAEWARDAVANKHKLMRTIDVPIVTLAEILSRNLPHGQEIDLLSVDVEGLDLEVLRSNDWDRYRPGLVMVEDLGIESLSRAADSRIVQFLNGNGYDPIAKTTTTLFFKRVDR